MKFDFMAADLRFSAVGIFFIAAFIAVYSAMAGCSESPDGGWAVAPRSLTAITAQRYEDTVEVGAKYDFSRIGIRAIYSDGVSQPVAAQWYENDFRIDPRAFFAPAEEGTLRLTASYSEGMSNFTLEVRINAVKAFSGAYFSSDPRRTVTAEVFIGRDTPVMSFFIGSPTTEALLVDRLSFALVDFSPGGALNSASLSDGRRCWRVKPSQDGSAVEFDFGGRPLEVPVNSVVEITLALDAASLPDRADGTEGAPPRVSLGVRAGPVALRGEFFGSAAMRNLNGLPLYSGPLCVQTPPGSSHAVAPIPAGSGYFASAAAVGPGASALFTLGAFGADSEKLSLLVINNSDAAGAYGIKAAAIDSPPAAVNFGPAGCFFAPGFGDGGRALPAVDGADAVRVSANYGQESADGYMREREEFLLKSVPPPRYGAPAIPSARAASVYKPGDVLAFHVVNVKTYQWHAVTAEVAAVGERCYIFQEAAMPSRYEALTPELAAGAAARFDGEIYPKVTGAFGSEPNPGIDGDPRIFILFTRVVNEGTALGYFSAMNQYRRFNENGIEQFRYSNEKEIIFSAVRDKESEFKDAAGFFSLLFNVMAHEFQHMINWHQHSLNGGYEETWVNEGLSMLAEDEAGYGCQREFYARRVADFFAAAGSYSLDNFKYLDRGSYGFSYLFFKYIRERGAAPRNMVASPKNGRTNVEAEIVRAGIAPDFATAFEEFVTALYFASEGADLEARHSFGGLRLRGSFSFAGAVNVTLAGIADSSRMCPPALFASGPLNGLGFNVIRYVPPETAGTVGFYLKNTGSAGIRVAPARHFKKLLNEAFK